MLIQEVLERNWVPRLLDWLSLTDLPAVQVRRQMEEEVEEEVEEEPGCRCPLLPPLSGQGGCARSYP